MMLSKDQFEISLEQIQESYEEGEISTFEFAKQLREVYDFSDKDIKAYLGDYRND